ncbi:MAG: YbbR-like domain-containing protein [Deltaproteobacteria bacterium]|nr:YbbR-like domain-containing protein [Deltaproteobacteria bacterium]
MEKLASKKINSWRDRPWPKNWVLKLISFFFALFLWYFVVGEDKVDTIMNIPVEILNLPADLTISNQFKNELELTVNGPRGLIRNLATQHISRPIDLSRAEPGTKVFQNTSDSISLPRGVRLLRVKPTDIILQLDKLITKNIPVHAVTTGTPPEGFELVSITLDPSSIPVTGPEVFVGQINGISTAPMDLAKLSEPTTRPVALKLSTDIKDLVGEPIVTASIVIQEKKVEKTVEDIPVKLLLSGKKTYTLKPDNITVKAKIPYNTLRKTKDLKTLFRARIMGVELSAGPHKLTVEVTPAQDVEILDIKPEMIVADINDEEETDSGK